MTPLADQVVVLKLSGEAFGEPVGDDAGPRPRRVGIQTQAFQGVIKQVRAITKMGIMCGIVVGGGNLVRGGSTSTAGLSRETVDVAGMLSTLINALTLRAGLEETREIKATVIAKPGVCEPLVTPWGKHIFSAGTAEEVVIVAGGTGRGGVSTDVAAPMLATAMGASLIVMSKHGVDGIYDRDPNAPGAGAAERLSSISVAEALERKLRIMNSAAMELCQQYGLTVQVVSAEDPNALVQVVRGEAIGSKLVP